MNCRPGDLAVVVRSTLGNTGRLVRVIESDPGNDLPEGCTYIVDGHRWRSEYASEFFWIVESLGSPLMAENGRGYKVRPFRDLSLRPIRPQPDSACDETLQRIPTPYLERA